MEKPQIIEMRKSVSKSAEKLGRVSLNSNSLDVEYWGASVVQNVMNSVRRVQTYEEMGDEERLAQALRWVEDAKTNLRLLENAINEARVSRAPRKEGA